MKRTILLLTALTIFSCKKNENKTISENEVKVTKTMDSSGVKKIDSTSEIRKTIDGKTIHEKNIIHRYEYTYKAFDGKEANITFTTGTKDGNFILIERNKLKIELPQKEAWAKGAIYEKDGIKAEAQGDKLTIHQNGQVFELNRKK